MKREDILEQPISRIYHRYLLPAIGGTLVTSVYILADTMMIGKGLGELEVAALNLMLPIYALLYGTGALFGVGGSTLYAYYIGKNEHERARGFFGVSLLMILGVVFLYLIGGFFFKENILTILGAKGILRDYARDYYHGLIFNFFAGTLSMFLQVFVRTDRNPIWPTIGVTAGGITNIILDYIFIYIFQWGMRGAALATAMGTTLTCLLLSGHFLRRDHQLRPRLNSTFLKDAQRVLQGGLPSLMTELSSGFLIFFMNYQTFKYLKEEGVIIYSVIGNVSIIVLSLVNGCCQSAAPIISMNYGAGHQNRVLETRKIGMLYSVVIGGGILAVGMLSPEWLIQLFIYPSPNVLTLGKVAIRLYFLSFPIFALCLFVGSYFQSVLKPQYAFILSLLKGFVIFVPVLYFLPKLIGVNGIWLGMPLQEGLSLLIVLGIIYLKEKINMTKTLQVKSNIK